MTKVVTIVGARPQFIKAAAVSRAFRRYSGRGRGIEEVIVHTGQHHDENMSKVFFDELDIPVPAHNLQISGGNHGAMTGRMLESIENVLLREKPHWVLVYGDTNSTLAGALAAVKLHIPVAHVEAGLRSFNTRMPEEINRVVSDRVSAMLLCPTDAAVLNLRTEGITENVYNIGDVMYDVALFYRERAKTLSKCMGKFSLREGAFALATCHRAENTDNPERLGGIVAALGRVAETMPVVLPLHPRTRKLLDQHDLAKCLGKVTVTEPLPFFDMIALEQAAKVIFTDSGGVQKEAFFYGVPCITLRDETEWVETVRAEANQLVGASTSLILSAFEHVLTAGCPVVQHAPYGKGDAADKIVALIAESYF